MTTTTTTTTTYGDNMEQTINFDSTRLVCASSSSVIPNYAFESISEQGSNKELTQQLAASSNSTIRNEQRIINPPTTTAAAAAAGLFESCFASGLDLSEFSAQRTVLTVNANDCHDRVNDDGDYHDGGGGRAGTVLVVDSKKSSSISQSSIWLAQQRRKKEWQLYQDEQEQQLIIPKLPGVYNRNIKWNSQQKEQRNLETNKIHNTNMTNNDHGNTMIMGQFYSTLVGMHDTDPAVEKSQRSKIQPKRSRTTKNSSVKLTTNTNKATNIITKKKSHAIKHSLKKR